MYPNQPEQPNGPPNPQPQQPPQWPPQPTAPTNPQPYPQQSTPITPPQQDYSIDYLNQISAPSKTSSGPNGKFLIGIIVGLLVLLGLVGAFLVFGNRSTPMDKAANMLMRMQTLEKVAKSQHKHLRDGQLRSSNSSYTLFLTNAIRDLKEPLESAGVNVNKLPKSQRDAEKAVETELNTRFDDARLNVRLDNTYSREMNYQLDILHSMMVSIYSSTSSSALKEYLETTEKNLAQVSESFEKVSDTK